MTPEPITTTPAEFFKGAILLKCNMPCRRIGMIMISVTLRGTITLIGEGHNVIIQMWKMALSILTLKFRSSLINI